MLIVSSNDDRYCCATASIVLLVMLILQSVMTFAVQAAESSVSSTHEAQQQQKQLPVLLQRGTRGGTNDQEEHGISHGTITIRKLQDSIVVGADDGDVINKNIDDDNNTNTNTNCGGILDTVCSMKDLELLCVLLQRLSRMNTEENDDDNGLDFLTQTGTFFAPTNLALDQLPSQFAVQLQNSDVLSNVLQYHAVMTVVDDNSTAARELYFVEELDCDEELVMMNNQTTKTLCVTNADGNEDKIQLGSGNMQMRSLPKIMQDNDDNSSAATSDIITCDQSAIIHVVDHVIVPSELPSPNINKELETISPLPLPSDDDDDDDDVTNNKINNNTTNCGGIHEMVCSNPRLELLCELLQQLKKNDDDDNSNDDSSIDFLLSTSTFFAPTNRAIMNLPSNIAVDMQKYRDVLFNVLQYHAVMTEEDDDTSNGTTAGGLLFLDDLECDEELIMMNNETTKTLCLAGFEDKIQFGSGNMPLRTLPKILPNSDNTIIMTCDHNSIIHLVDQVIVPGLPLTGGSSSSSSSSGDGDGDVFDVTTPTQPISSLDNDGTDDGDDDNDASMGTEEVTIEGRIDDDNCPMIPPDIANSGTAGCNSIGATCGYGHVYTGCNWIQLQCTPTTNCVCIDGGSWECTAAVDIFPCDDGSTFSIEDGLPWNEECDSDEELPEPPRLTPPPVAECPEYIEYGTCSETYLSNLVCNYDYIWFGCTWEELECSPVKECECNQFGDGNWACLSFAMIPCDERTTPPDLPWGQYCDDTT